MLARWLTRPSVLELSRKTLHRGSPSFESRTADSDRTAKRVELIGLSLILQARIAVRAAVANRLSESTEGGLEPRRNRINRPIPLSQLQKMMSA
jgi:hypothetical protein